MVPDTCMVVHALGAVGDESFSSRRIRFFGGVGNKERFVSERYEGMAAQRCRSSIVISRGKVSGLARKMLRSGLVFWPWNRI